MAKISLILLSAMLVSFSSASLLLVDRKNPCRAYGNASVYDITNLVPHWPAQLLGAGADNSQYYYWWSCAGMTQKCQDTDVAVCQQRTDEQILTWNAGNVSPQMWFGVFNGPAGQVRFDFAY